MRKTLEERFWGKVTRAGLDECWDWQEKSRDPYGYGCFNVGRSQRAHVTAWTLTHGPVPKGLCVCHTCDRPPCCNPAHLFLDTHAGNTADMMRKGRGRYEAHRGEDHGSAKLTWPQVREIRRRYACGGIRQQDLADEYGISRSNINRIVLHQTWLE